MQLRHLAVAAGILLIGGWVIAEEAAEPIFEPYVGEVTIETLNVRAGPSANYYVVTRLHAGARARVVGEQTGWLAIVPPEGCFSLIAGEYVDRGDGVNGVVNADNVRVRAGSELSSHNYAVQLKLQRGALVKILGQADDQYMKIEPPAGATLWASGKYVRRVPPDRLDTEAGTSESLDHPPGFDSALPVSGAHPVPPDAAEDKPTSDAAVTDAAVAEAELQPEDTTPADISVSGDEYRRRLEALDAELDAEMDKPLLRRNLADLLPRYCKLAEQEVDPYTQAYAGVRVEQIETAAEMVDGVQKVRQLREEIRAVRKAALAGRANLRPVPTRIEGGFDAEGELRPSALYDSPVGPRRYRLVDPDARPARTLGYVEVPPEAAIDVTSYLGRRVGVRASERILQTGNVNPIAIYVAAELVVLDRPTDASPDGLAEDASTSTEETKTASNP